MCGTGQFWTDGFVSAKVGALYEACLEDSQDSYETSSILTSRDVCPAGYRSPISKENLKLEL